MFLSLVQIVQCGQITSYDSINPCTEKHVPNVPVSFLGTFTKLQKATINFVVLCYTYIAVLFFLKFYLVILDCKPLLCRVEHMSLPNHFLCLL